MEMKHNRSSPKMNDGTPDEATNGAKGLAFPALPNKMIIAIDGWAQTGKNTSGELVAEHLGAVLVDSGRFYRALTKACLDSQENLGDGEAVAAWCKDVALDV